MSFLSDFSRLGDRLEDTQRSYNYGTYNYKTPKSKGGFARGARGAIKSYTGTSIHRAGMQEVKEMFGMGKHLKGLFRFTGPAFMLYSAISGFQEGGMMGAAKNVARDAALSYGFGVARSIVGGGMPIMAAAGAMGIGLLGLEALNQGVSPLQMLARPLVREHTKKRAKLEMGAPVQDQYGTVATMRQRSIMAMRQSKITARSALGMEGSRRYTPYLR
jgi:hypothetical protein